MSYNAVQTILLEIAHEYYAEGNWAHYNGEPYEAWSICEDILIEAALGKVIGECDVCGFEVRQRDHVRHLGYDGVYHPDCYHHEEDDIAEYDAWVEEMYDTKVRIDFWDEYDNDYATGIGGHYVLIDGVLRRITKEGFENWEPNLSTWLAEQCPDVPEPDCEPTSEWMIEQYLLNELKIGQVGLCGCGCGYPSDDCGRV